MISDRPRHVTLDNIVCMVTLSVQILPLIPVRLWALSLIPHCYPGNVQEVDLDQLDHELFRVSTYLENLEKSGSSKVVREKSGKMKKMREKSLGTEISVIVQSNYH